MSDTDPRDRLRTLRAQIGALRTEMRTIQTAIEPQSVADYALATLEGERRLSSWFCGKRDLIVIHNMGRACAYCTLWADGFNGVYAHLASRAGFLVTSPDSPASQDEFAAARGWRFPMASHAGSTFAADMGYRGAHGWLPGVSVFQQRDGALARVSDAAFAPGDDFCAVWHLYDLLPEGAGGWSPRLSY